MTNSFLSEAKRLHDLGFAIHWLHPKSKRPVEAGWTTGPRKTWADLTTTYKVGFNVGVRLGEPSVIDGKYLAVIDVDVKSTDNRHQREVSAYVVNLAGGLDIPEVTSGRGNGSRHYYILVDTPERGHAVHTSPDVVKVAMPGSAKDKPSKRELEALTAAEIAAGVRLRPAWEIDFMGTGRQVVLPPSIHPDSGKPYTWAVPFVTANAAAHGMMALINTNEKAKPTAADRGPVVAVDDFKLSPVEMSWLPVDDKIKKMITTGEGVEDRSAALLPICHALHRAALTPDEILTVLTDPDNYIGATAYHHAKTKSRDKAAAWLYKYTLKKVIDDADVSKKFLVGKDAPSGRLTDDQVAAQQAAFDDMDDWRTKLDVTDKDRTRATLKNVVLILGNVVGKSLVRRDLFKYRDFYGLPTPWGGVVGEVVTDDDVTKIKLWLGENWLIEPNSTVIGEALTIFANRNAFDPVLDWLGALPAWDERPRLDTWLAKNFQARGNAEYLAQVFRKWLCAMVLRAQKPGTKFDWLPIFEGDQGVGKSSFGRLLCTDEYFVDWLPDLNQKDAALGLQGAWAVEMGELASFRRTELETVKAFITRTVDKVRPPYGQRLVEMKRRCVFFGTTNSATYLRDDSGNRRSKPVEVGWLNFDALRADREQLFAEAVWLLKTGFETEWTLELTGEAKTAEKIIHDKKMVSDDASLMADSLRRFIAENSGPNGAVFAWEKFSMEDLFHVGIGGPLRGTPLSNWRFDSRNAQFAAKALKSLSAESWKVRGLKYWKLDVNDVGGIG